MFKNYLKITLRNILKYKGYSLINIGGLATGLAICIIIFLFVRNQLSYDSFHDDAENIYRIVAEEIESGEIRPAIPEDISRHMLEDYPEVEEYAVYSSTKELLVSANGKHFYDDKILYVNPEFLQFFTFKPLFGVLKNALSDPGSVVITKTYAKKYFGTENVVGETITTRDEETLSVQDNRMSRNQKGETIYTIAAVLEPIPSNSSIVFDMLIPFQPNDEAPYWWNFGNYNFIKLRPDTEPEQLENKLTVFLKKYGGRSAEDYTLHLQPLTNVHLYPNMGKSARIGPIEYVYIFSLAGLLILGIAIINFMNLSTARSSQRAREVGVRKVLGGYKGQLMRQFLTESVLISGLSMGLALVMVEFLLPLFNQILGANLSVDPILQPVFFLGLLAIVILVGLLSGSYLAFILSQFNPSHAIKGMTTSNSHGKGFRNTLVVVQFIGSILLILASIIMYKQMEFIRQERLNVLGEEVVVIDNKNDAIDQQYDTFKQELLSHSSILSITSGQKPGNVGFRTAFTPKDSTSHFKFLSLMWVEYDYLKTLGYEIISGTDFSNVQSNDLNTFKPKIINKTAAQINELEGKIGQEINLNGTGQLVGIVEDFYMESMYEEITPLVIEFREGAHNTILVRLRSNEISMGLEIIRQLWNKFVENRPLHYSFLDETLDQQYRTELQIADLFLVFTLIAIAIACFGLFGLVAFSTEQRTKEIGIRKVLGATITNIIALLSKDFIKLVILGFVFACPIAWYAMNQWLADFAYRIEIGPGIFALAGGAALVIAFLTVSWQSIKAAVANPVDSLRSE